MGWVVGVRWVMMRARSSLGRVMKGQEGDGDEGIIGVDVMLR